MGIEKEVANKFGFLSLSVLLGFEIGICNWVIIYQLINGTYSKFVQCKNLKIGSNGEKH